MKFLQLLSAKMMGLVLVLFANYAAANSFDIKPILELGPTESWPGQIFHANTLWTGSSRTDAGYRLYAFKGNGDALGSVQLQHSIYEIFAYDANSVVVTGNAERGSHGAIYSFYSIVRRSGDQLQIVQQAGWPLDVNVLHFATFQGRSFWGAPGGSLADNEHSTEPGVPSIMTGSPSHYSFLPIRLPFLGGLTFFNANTLIAMTGNAALGDINIHTINLETNTAHAVFPSNHQPLFEPTIIDENTIAYAERETSEIHLIDVANSKLIRSIPLTAGTPRGLAKIGHCLAVASQEEKVITFIDIANNDQVVEMWTLSEQLTGVRMIKKLTVDVKSKTVFIRAAFPYGEQGEQNGVAMIRQIEGDVFAKCLN